MGVFDVDAAVVTAGTLPYALITSQLGAFAIANMAVKIGTVVTRRMNPRVRTHKQDSLGVRDVIHAAGQRERGFERILVERGAV